MTEMIYLHKILPLITAPLAVVVFFLVIGAVKRRPAFSVSGLLILLVFKSLFRRVDNKTGRKAFCADQHRDFGKIRICRCA